MEADRSGGSRLYGVDRCDYACVGWRRLCIWSPAFGYLHSDAEVIACGMEILLYTTVTYFLCGLIDLSPELCEEWDILSCSDDYIDHWNGRTSNCMDFLGVPEEPFAGCTVHFLSGIVDSLQFSCSSLASGL